MIQLILIDVNETPHISEIWGRRIRRNIDRIIEQQEIRRQELTFILPGISIKKALEI